MKTIKSSRIYISRLFTTTEIPVYNIYLQILTITGESGSIVQTK